MSDYLTAHAPLSFSVKQRRALAAILAVGVVAVLILGELGINPFRPSGADATYQTIFGSATPKLGSSTDNQAVELGTRFKAIRNGKVTAIRFWKSSLNTGSHTGSLWDATGKVLARVTFTHETASGWQVATLASPVVLVVDKAYVVSYHTSTGHYADDPGYFTGGGAGSQSVRAYPDGVAGRNSIYHYGSTTAFPTNTWKASNYWVDVVFRRNGSGGTSTTTTPPPTLPPTTAAPSTTAAPTTTTTAPPTTTTTPPPPSGSVNCPLTAAGEGCWATHTGVPGWTEAQIVAGQSPLQHVSGDLTITTSGTVVANKWFDGCIAVKASNVTIQNVLVRTTHRCRGGNGGDAGSAIDTGNSAASLSNVRVIDSEVDGLDMQADSVGVGTTSVSCVRCNVHGFTKNLWLSDNTSSKDSYLHDQTMYSTTHTDVIMIYGGSNITVDHNYVKSNPNNPYTTGAIGLLGGGTDHVTLNNNYCEGGAGWDISGGAPNGTNIWLTNNALSPNNGWGGTDWVKYYDPSAPGNVWSNNFNSETRAQVTSSGVLLS